MSSLRVSLAAATLVSALSSPAFAADTMTSLSVFVDAAVPIKLMILALLGALVAAVIVTARKTASQDVAGGSAFLSALRLGAPLLGLLGAALNALWSFMAIATLGRSPPLAVYAPGLAEATFVLSLGLFVGVVAVVCNWAVEARIDRAVLRA